jgi:hypothetical protein
MTGGTIGAALGATATVAAGRALTCAMERPSGICRAAFNFALLLTAFTIDPIAPIIAPMKTNSSYE